MAAEPSRADEVQSLLSSIQELVIPHIRAADDDAATKGSGHGLQVQGGAPRTVLVEQHPPQKLQSLLNLMLPDTGLGAPGVVESADEILKYSVNTWDRGFMDKLYASPDAAGLAAELLLAALNTNVHVYAVSPVLTLIEKHTTRNLALLFGYDGPHAGGIMVPGGATSNAISMTIARNVLFPQIKTEGNRSAPAPLAIFTSEESHYSISVAAGQLGLGSLSVRKVAVDAHGAMDPSALSSLVDKAVADGNRPFYVCATSGTTVRGAFDPLTKISGICRKHSMWLHVDACWGGPAIFSPKHRHKLHGSHLADSIAINPHKMMGVPIVCSFLLGKDMRTFWKANSLEARYLFHGDGEDPEGTIEAELDKRGADENSNFAGVPTWDEVHDLATFSPQCGRRGDSLKFFLAWKYHGAAGFALQVERAFAAAQELADRLSEHSDIRLISDRPPPCCQVCFYYVGDGGKLGSKENSRVTRSIVRGLVRKGWMIDYAAGNDGEFMRAVCNRGTDSRIVTGLVAAIREIGAEVTRKQ